MKPCGTFDNTLFERLLQEQKLEWPIEFTWKGLIASRIFESLDIIRNALALVILYREIVVDPAVRFYLHVLLALTGSL